MLNELREFEEYSQMLSKKKIKDGEPRMLPAMFFQKKDNTVRYLGIPRVLSIVARYHLFNKRTAEGKRDYASLETSEQREELREEVRQVLEKICFDKNCLKYEGLYNYFKNYGPDDSEILWEEFNKKRNTDKSWKSNSIYRILSYNNNAIFNSVSFQMILADAISAGPLKNWYLVCDKSFWEDVYSELGILEYSRSNDIGAQNLKKNQRIVNDRKKHFPVATGKDAGKIQGHGMSHLDRLLKTIACYLLEGGDINDNENVCINRVNLANWLGVKGVSDQKKKYSYYYKNEEIVLANPLLKGFISLNKSFMRMYNFHISETPPDPAKGEIAFIDTGAGKGSLISYTLRYQDVEKALINIPRFGKTTNKEKLKNTEIILKKLGILNYYKGSYSNGDRSEGPRVVHIAGTNGKGSVAKFISLMLEKKGYKTGLFTSPHLIKLTERISINGNAIPDGVLVDIYDRVKSVVDKLVESQKADQPAFFEFVFIMAVLYYKEQNCDYVVLETGLGGRLDATNIVTPEVSIITSIGFDHMQYLGDTIEKIAGEKAGIIKKRVPVVYNTGEEDADRVIEEKAEKSGCQSFKVGDYSKSILEKAGAETVKLFDSFSAKYQKDNFQTASLAFAVLEGKVAKTGKKLKKLDEAEVAVLNSAVKDFRWDGRMQYLDSSHNFLVDGAHNEDAIIRFAESFDAIIDDKYSERDVYFPRVPVSLLFAVSNDKDYDNIVKVLSEMILRKSNEAEFSVFVGELDGKRRTQSKKVVKLFNQYLNSDSDHRIYVEGYKSVQDAWGSMIYMWECEDEEYHYSDFCEPYLFVAVGSLYLVGDVKKLYEKYIGSKNLIMK